MYIRAKSVVCRNIVVYARNNRLDGNRLGLTCTKAVGKAHDRNRAKRLMREAYRLNEEHIRCGIDVIIVARTRAKDASFSEVEKDFLYASRKLLLLEDAK